MLRVVLAEDAVLLRAGLVELLAKVGHRVVAAVGDAAALARAVDAERPDVVITDVRMPPDFRRGADAVGVGVIGPVQSAGAGRDATGRKAPA